MSNPTNNAASMVEDERPIDRLRVLVKTDTRYPVEAYLFIFEALRYTLDSIGEQRHVDGGELCHGIRDKALECFGPLAGCVFRQWGISGTEDFGHIVFNLIEVELMSKTDSDRIEDFVDVFDLEEACTNLELEVSLAH